LAFFFRFDPSGATSSQNLVSYGARSTAGSLHLYLATINPATGTVALRTNLPGLPSTALDVTRTAPSSWQDGVWRHYALAVSADGSARVYIDGVLLRTATGRTGRLATDELLWLGWRPAGGFSTAFMSGGLRDIRVYQRTLPASEVQSLFTGRLSYTAWLTANNLSSSLAANADPDGNGLSSFLEYALGSRAASPVSAPRYEVAVMNDRLTLSFIRETSAQDLRWTIEGTDNLASTWQPVARRAYHDAGWTILTTGATAVETNGRVIVTDGSSVATQPRRFLRLRVEAWN
jgi:hypothetical protein